MSKINFSKLGLKNLKETTEVTICEDFPLEIRLYLPIEEKTAFLRDIVTGALDDETGCFSPIRIEVWFAISLCKYYANISFTDKQLENVGKTYDLLEENGVIDEIAAAIPAEEFAFMRGIVDESVKDIARYNSSAAGIIHSAGNNAEGLNEQLTEILEKMKSPQAQEGMELYNKIVQNG